VRFMVSQAENRFGYYFHKGFNRICFKETTINDKIAEYLRTTPLWARYQASIGKTNSKTSDDFTKAMFLSAKGVKELSEIGKISYSEDRALELPTPKNLSDSFTSVLQRRRSSHILDVEWNAEDLSTLLSCSYGITAVTSHGKKLRSYPSPGALYPNDLYLIVINVMDVPKGLYIFDPYSTRLVLVTNEIDGILSAFQDGDLISKVKIVSILVGNPFRACLKYGDVGYKFVLLDAGIIIENIVLSATALRKNVLPYESFYDSDLNRCLGLDGVAKFVTSSVLLG
jgi:SagB-type dehydrogenase family enzyme